MNPNSCGLSYLNMNVVRSYLVRFYGVFVNDDKLIYTKQYFSGVSPIYESINFDATPAPYLRASHQIKANKLRRQDAFDDSAQNERNRGSSRDIRSFFNSCIPPPPAESPPSVKDPDDKHDPVEISSNTLEKLNSLYSAYKLNRSVSNESDELNDVVYRLREFNDFSSRRYRGSSKAMCSLVSV